MWRNSLLCLPNTETDYFASPSHINLTRFRLLSILYRSYSTPYYDADQTTIYTQTPDYQGETKVIRYGPDDTVNQIEQNYTVVATKNYNDQFAPGEIADANGNTTTTSFNAQGQPLQKTNARSEVSQFEYDLLHRPVVVTDTLGRRTEMMYDTNNNLTRQTTDMLGSFPGFITSYTYNVRYPGKNWLEDVTTPDGVRIRNDYDAFGQITAVTQNYVDGVYDQARPNEDLRTSYEYDTYGRVIATTVGGGTPLERRDVTDYNADNTVARTIQNYIDGVIDLTKPNEDVVTQYGYDKLGRKVWTKDALGHYSATHYDVNGRVDWSMQNLVPFQRDSTEQPVFQPFSPAVPDANIATLYEYDGLGRATRVTQTGLLAGAFDRATRAFAEATTRVTFTEYDALNRPIATTQNYQPNQSARADVNVRSEMQYDNVGNLLWQRDGLGRWTHTEYDVLSRPITVTVNYENGSPLTIDTGNETWATTSDTDFIQVTQYGDAGQVAYTIDNYVDGVFDPNDPAHDRKTVYLYDALGREWKTITNYEDGNPATGGTDTDVVTETSYDAVGRVQGTRDPLGRWTSQQYDALSRAVGTMQNCRDAAGTQVAVGCASFVATAADRNVPTTMQYDVLGRTFRVTDALNHTMLTSFDILGRVIGTTQNEQPGLSATSDRNVTTLQAFDILGRATTMTDAVGATTQTAYDALGRATATTDSLQRLTRIGYDGTGAQRWQETPDGRFAVMLTDGLGRVTQTIANYIDGQASAADAVDQDLVTRTQYDAAGRPTATIAPDGKKTAFVYDLRDQLIQVTENVTATCATTATDCNVVTQYAYDRAGNRITITDANTNQRSFGYDAMNRQVRSTDGLQQTTTWAYDRAGRKISQDDPRDAANTLTFGYDEADRLTSSSASNLGTPVTTEYDALGRRRWLEDATGRTNFGYDALGRMKTVQAPTTGTVGYDYNARGERTLLTYPDATSIAYTYLPDGQLDLVQLGTTTLANYEYDAVGRVQQLVRSNGAITIYGYDQADRIRDMHTTVGTNTIARFQYDVNRAGLRTRETEPVAPNAVLVNDIDTSGSSYPGTASSVNGVMLPPGVSIDGTYFFAASDAAHGRELWRTDGTPNGTVLVSDMQAGSESAAPEDLTVLNGRLVFTADDGVHGRELWVSDGTTAGTMLLKDILPGSANSNITNMTLLGSRIVFIADDGTRGAEVWQSDGTAAETTLVKDIQSGSNGAAISQLTVVNGLVFFAAFQSTTGFELWKSDGTPAGTVLVKDIAGGNVGSSPAELTAVNGVLYFTARYVVYGRELWKSDGTAAGTVLVKDITPGVASSNPESLTAANNSLVFVADDGAHGRELWQSTGTATGTLLLQDTWPGSNSSDPSSMLMVGGTLVFTADDGVHGSELWRSDGSSNGTTLLKDILAGSDATDLFGLTVVNNQLYFAADDGVHGSELWRSDGTAAGTTLLKDIWAGSDSAYPSDLTEMHGRLFFTAEEGDHGKELWATDGTEAGTVLAEDINPGTDGSYPYKFHVVNGTLFFSANDGTHDTELWAYTDAANVLYQYDGLNRLVGATANQRDDYRYAYDRAGNRTDVWTNLALASHHDYDAANQVDGWQYDGAGNLRSDSTTSYTYDALNRLIGRGQVNYSYNGDGALVSQVNGATTTNYTQDLAAPLSQVLDDGSTNYLYGRERFAGANSTTRTWYIGDALNSVRTTLNDAGAVVGSTTYDPWGTSQQPMIAPFGFTGELQDGANVYLRARWYTPQEGRFTSPDPWSGDTTRPQSLHKYSYAENDSINAIDPTGLRRIRIWTSAFIAPQEIKFLYPQPSGDDVTYGPAGTITVRPPFTDFFATFEGNGRGFSSGERNSHSPMSKLWHEVVIDTDLVDPLVFQESGVGPTDIRYMGRDGLMHDSGKLDNSLQKQTPAQVESGYNPFTGNQTITISIEGQASIPRVLFAPAIKYQYFIVFEKCKNEVRFFGEHTGFPSHELFISGLGPQHQFDPGATSISHLPFNIGNNPALLFTTEKVQPATRHLDLDSESDLLENR